MDAAVKEDATGRPPIGRRARRAVLSIAGVTVLAAGGTADAYRAPGPTATTAVARAAPKAVPAQPSVRAAPTAARPNVDRRLRGARPVARAATSAATDRARAALRAALGPQAVVTADPITGGLRMVARLDGSLTEPASGDPADLALDYVRAHRDAFGLTGADLDTLVLDHRSTSPDGITHLHWVHAVDGVEVLDRDLRASVTRDGRVLDLQGAPLHDVDDSETDPSVTPRNALAAAQRAAGTPVDVPLATAPRGPAMAVTFAGGDTARLTLFPTATGARLGWRVIAEDPDANVTYASVIDARTGRLLQRRSLTFAANAALVYDHYPGAPGAGGAAHPVDLAPWLDAPATTRILSGPNVRVWKDADDDGVAEPPEEIAPSSPSLPSQWSYTLQAFTTLTPQVNPPYDGHCPSAGCTWNPVAAPNQQQHWATNADADGAQVFYLVNRFHDYLAAPPVGFTAAARGLEGFDRLLAQVLAGASSNGNGQLNPTYLNNANMTTLPDGQSPFMRMYLFAPNPDGGDAWRLVNGGDDASIVYHEYTHAYTGRTIVDASGTQALGSDQSGAMAEGWSDWFAEDFLYASGLAADNSAVAGEVVLGAYESANPIGQGSRSEPLDCPPGVPGPTCPGTPSAGPGGDTYGDMGNVLGDGHAEVHADGEIWSQTLWDLRTRLGHDTALAIVAGGVRLTPPEPSMLDARDAILRAALVVGGLGLQYQAWQTFAARGMGVNARTFNANDVHPIQDFTAPPAPATCFDGSLAADAASCPQPPPPPQPFQRPRAPQATLRLGGTRRKLATALTNGVRVRVVTSEDGDASASGSVSAADANRSRLGTSRRRHTAAVVVARGAARLKANVARSFTLRFTADARRKLARRTTVKVSLRIPVTSTATGRVRTLKATLTLKR